MLDGVHDLQGREIQGVELSHNLHLPTYDSPGGSTDQRFRVLPNYLGHLLNEDVLQYIQIRPRSQPL